jgi:hypothetical protein
MRTDLVLSVDYVSYVRPDDRSIMILLSWNFVNMIDREFDYLNPLVIYIGRQTKHDEQLTTNNRIIHN